MLKKRIYKDIPQGKLAELLLYQGRHMPLYYGNDVCLAKES